MKKSLIAIAVSGLVFATASQAAPQANTFYVGAKVGWASFHDGVKQFDAKYNNGVGYGMNRNAIAYDAFVGYQVTNNLAAEVGYEFFGRNRGTHKSLKGTGKDKESFNHRAHGTVISLKGSYPIIADLDVYTRAGVALVNNTYKTVDPRTHIRTQSKRFQTSLVLGGGLEYAILPELAVSVDYQWVNNVGKASQYTLNRVYQQSNAVVTDYRPDVSSVKAGLTYRFGQGAKAPVEVVSEKVTKNFAFSSDVLFDFGKSNLKPAATQALDAAYTEISSLGLANPSIQVSGYTDRIGKDAPNLKLSQRRAESVANYIVSKGVDAQNITAVGYGKANSVTGNTCDVVKMRQALIVCLAPDRRVEVQVQGSKQVEM